MSKVIVVSAVGVSIFLLFLVVSPSKVSKVSQEITDLHSKVTTQTNREKETETFPASDGRQIIKGALPPELKTIQEKFEEYTKEIKKTAPPKEPLLENGRDPDVIIAQMDQLIEETSVNLGIDTASIVAPLYTKTPLNSDLQEVEKKRLEVEKDVIELERLFE